MKAWIYNGVICTILPSEADPESMGKIYDLPRDEWETLEDIKYFRGLMIRCINDANDRLVRKLIREQGE